VTAPDLIAHLLRRAGFGATASELTASVAAGYGPTVERLVGSLEQPDPGADAIAAPILTTPPTDQAALRADPAARMALFRTLQPEHVALTSWWLARMTAATNPLTKLDMAVSAFVDAMGSSDHGKQTTVLVYTEFGRRVTGNASAGTNHGWANVAFAAGPAVKGGFYGEPPNLAKLSEGNLVYTTDFRSLYATVFSEILGVDPKSFLGAKFPTISFV
jgi:uncharacterized protein (DUF1501 family)